MKKCTKCKITKEHSAFSPRKNNLTSWCRECKREYDRAAYKSNTGQGKNRRERLAKTKKESYLKNRQYVWDYLTMHPCVDCGECDPIVLEFDHIDPSTKLNDVSKLMVYGMSRLTDEIEKCEVRCANCHKRKTAKQFNYYDNIQK